MLHTGIQDVVCKPAGLWQNAGVAALAAAWAGSTMSGAAVQAKAPGGMGLGADVLPLSRRTLHDELVTRIRDMIIEGQLGPGTRVHEGQLGQALGVSRTPLREALKFLASEGLIELVPGRGAVVQTLTPRTVREMLDVLSALETLAGRLACRLATDGQIAEIRALHDAMIADYRAQNRLDYYKRNQAIHTAIARFSDNAFLASTHEMIQARLKRIRFIGHGDAEKWQAAVDEHEEMMAALEARDEDRLAAVLARHMTMAWERVQGVV
jgi:DNA-binding GntR family transcriptional regulator